MCLAQQTKPSAKGRDPEFNRNSERRNRQRENESIILMSRGMLGVRSNIGKMPLKGIAHPKMSFCHHLLTLSFVEHKRYFEECW